MLSTRQVGARPFGPGEFVNGARIGEQCVAKRLRGGGGAWGRAGSAVLRERLLSPLHGTCARRTPGPALCHRPLVLNKICWVLGP